MDPKSKTTPSTALHVMPYFYYHFFTFVEPFLTILGSIYATFNPIEYFKELVPPSVALRPAMVHPSGIMAVRQLGSCFFLLALIATVFLKHMTKSLKNQPDLLEPLISSYLLCLAIADLTHIGFTFFDVGLYVTLRPAEWNTLIYGNCVITTGLFIVRMAWFAGIGRDSIYKKSKKM